MQPDQLDGRVDKHKGVEVTCESLAKVYECIVTFNVLRKKASRLSHQMASKSMGISAIGVVLISSPELHIFR